MPTSATESRPAPHKETPKDTVISVLIAFIMAFVFRAFVVEAYIIPTGSMAPTLNGAHMRFQSAQTGFNWAVTPWEFDDATQNAPTAIQGLRSGGITVHDPMSGQTIYTPQVPRRAGDRILVLKYLYGVQSPARYDAVVFKNPTDPSVNYIKRLIGLPGEQVALIDGDVFTRQSSPLPPGDEWSAPGWAIQRKPHDVQRALWLPVFDTLYTPADLSLGGPGGPGGAGAGPFTQPWKGKGWTSDARGVFTSGSPGVPLEYDTSETFISARGIGRLARQLIDYYPYNEHPRALRHDAKVSDLRVRVGVIPEGPIDDSFEFVAMVRARSHEFRGVIRGSSARVEFRPMPEPGTGVEPAWTELASGTVALKPGRVTAIELWHFDQTVELWADGALVTRGGTEGRYDWSPLDRVKYATGQTLADNLAQATPPQHSLANHAAYRSAAVQLSCSRRVTLTRIGLDRDVHYQSWASQAPNGLSTVGLATLPGRVPTLLKDQYFCLGDNSPASSDGRYWGLPEAWVSFLMRSHGMSLAHQEGVVPHDLMLGKAFFVYFPAPAGSGWAWWIPDFGRLRFIR